MLRTRSDAALSEEGASEAICAMFPTSITPVMSGKRYSYALADDDCIYVPSESLAAPLAPTLDRVSQGPGDANRLTDIGAS